MENFSEYLREKFGVDEDTFKQALTISPSARGYISGAISEVFLSRYLEDKGFEVLRIKEKPKGGNDAKSSDARGDFYVRPAGSKDDKWLVIESKGLKSNSEFRGGKLDSPKKLLRFLQSITALDKDKESIYKKAFTKYTQFKNKWEERNSGKSFPNFAWSKEFPGPITPDLKGVWSSEKELKEWVNSQPPESFTESSYRKMKGPITILETHQPSKRISPMGINQTAPLVADFNIMAVDLYLRTGKHQFVFMSSNEISHSPVSPEHLYQNYTIDILVRGKKEDLRIERPWYSDITDCIRTTKPKYRNIDKTQLDDRENN